MPEVSRQRGPSSASSRFPRQWRSSGLGGLILSKFRPHSTVGHRLSVSPVYLAPGLARHAYPIFLDIVTLPGRGYLPRHCRGARARGTVAIGLNVSITIPVVLPPAFSACSNFANPQEELGALPEEWAFLSVLFSYFPDGWSDETLSRSFPSRGSDLSRHFLVLDYQFLQPRFRSLARRVAISESRGLISNGVAFSRSSEVPENSASPLEKRGIEESRMPVATSKGRDSSAHKVHRIEERSGTVASEAGDRNTI